MPSKMFDKEDLLEILSHDLEGFKIKEDVTVDTSRWSEIHSLVFFDPRDKKHYNVHYSQGLTELQDESPFECEDDEIECFEVYPREVTAIQWTNV